MDLAYYDFIRAIQTGASFAADRAGGAALDSEFYVAVDLTCPRRDVVEHGVQGVWDGWKGLEWFRSPLLAWLVTTLIAVFVSPSLVTGLGLWRAYVLEPALVFFILKSIQYPVRQLADRKLLTLCSFRNFPDSSTVEQEAVNFKVRGSNPRGGA